MKQGIRLHLSNPCHENWAYMLPAQQGRFCTACQKQVIDFSQLTDAQLLQYFTYKTGTVCGKFAPDQLNRLLQPAAQPVKQKGWWSLLLSLLLLYHRAGAQQKGGPASHSILHAPVPGLQQQRIAAPTATWPGLFLGRVVDEQQQPVAFATIECKEPLQKCVADSLGGFILSTAGPLPVSLVVSAVGYLPLEQTIDVANGRQDTFTLKMAVQQLGEVVVSSTPTKVFQGMLGGISVSRLLRPSAKDQLVSCIRSLLPNPGFALYPNPVQRTQLLMIRPKVTGSYTLQVYSSSGVLLHAGRWLATAGSPYPLQVPANWAAGWYCLRLLAADGRPTYEDKFLVQ